MTPIEEQIKLPGFGRPIDAWSKDPKNEYAQQLSAVQSWNHRAMTLREQSMLYLMNTLTDKPGWMHKVYDEEIVEKWKQEAMAIDWSNINGSPSGVSEEMFKYCMQELRDKAILTKETGVVPVLDVSSCILKGDNLVPAELKAQLKKAVAILEDVPEEQKDWHPGSNEKVLNLVHPSLYPLVYGRSCILPRGTIRLDNCLGSIGVGVTLEKPSADQNSNEEIVEREHTSDKSKLLWSSRFQWLPCNVSFPDGENARIDSYINNLHPVDHADLYKIIEKLITIATPLWNIVYQCNEFGNLKLKPRIVCDEITFTPHPDEIDTQVEDIGKWHEYERWRRGVVELREYNYPEPVEYRGCGYTAEDVRDKLKFLGGTEKGMQVIVKLANIHLTPKKPSYEGGSWHIEGQLNEHIVATALYYYDNENTTDSHLSFRTIVDSLTFELDRMRYEWMDTVGIRRLFGVEDATNCVQPLGSVLTREDRMIAFPNGFQHCVEPFELADKTRPGHRKIVALFLVAPTVPIISTANVPPQQLDWWIRELQRARNKTGELPVELFDMVREELGGLPISLEEAKGIRSEVMAERNMMTEAVDKKLHEPYFNFCEH